MAKSRRQFLKLLGISPALPLVTTFLPEQKAPELPVGPSDDEIAQMVADGVKKSLLEAQEKAQTAIFSAVSFSASATHGFWVDDGMNWTFTAPSKTTILDVDFDSDLPSQGRTRG